MGAYLPDPHHHDTFLPIHPSQVGRASKGRTKRLSKIWRDGNQWLGHTRTNPKMTWRIMPPEQSCCQQSIKQIHQDVLSQLLFLWGASFVWIKGTRLRDWVCSTHELSSELRKGVTAIIKIKNKWYYSIVMGGNEYFMGVSMHSKYWLVLLIFKVFLWMSWREANGS